MIVPHQALGFLDLVSSFNKNVSRYLLAVLLYLERKWSSDFKELAEFQRQRKGRMRNERGLHDSKAHARSFRNPGGPRWRCSSQHFNEKTRVCGLLEGGGRWALPLSAGKDFSATQSTEKEKAPWNPFASSILWQGSKAPDPPRMIFSLSKWKLTIFFTLKIVSFPKWRALYLTPSLLIQLYGTEFF